MKKLFLLSALILSLFASAQVYDVPVKAGDTVTIRKSSSNLLFTIPAIGLDSAFKFTLQKFQSVPVVPPPSDTLKIVASSSKSGTSTLTHTVTAPAGSVIVVLAGFSGSGKNCTIGGSATLTWSKNADAQASNSGDAEIFTSNVTTSGSYTITTNFDAFAQWSYVAVVTGCEGVGAKATAVAQAAPSVSITTTKSNSLLLMISADFNGRDGSARKYRDGATDLFYNRASDKSGASYTYSKVAATIGTYTEGLTAPLNMAAGTAIIELKSKSGTSVVDTIPPSAPSLNVTSSTTTSIDVSWTTSVDNTSVTGYDVYVDGKLRTTTTQISYSVTGLTPSTQYNIFVKAKDGYGNSTSSNTVTASTLTPANQAPVANAGADVTLVLPSNSTTLNGSGSKDSDGSIVFYNWSYLSGPSQWLLGNADQMSTPLTNLVKGVYVFRLKVTDDKGAIGVDDITINVTSAIPTDTTSMPLYGFGKDAVGGSKSSTVYHVTNTGSSGAGSLSNGLGSNKTIVFDIAGTFPRTDVVNLSYLTIDGSTAPYPGVTLTTKGGDGLTIDGSSHHIIIKGITFANCNGDGANAVNGTHDIAFINCTAYGNGDGNIDLAMTSGQNITLQLCIIGYHIAPSDDGTGGVLVTTKNASILYNLFNVKSDEEGERCPLVHCNYSPVGAPNADIRNNLVWNWGRSNATGSGGGSQIGYNAAANIINNYYKTTSSVAAADAIVINADGTKSVTHSHGNISGNGINLSTTKYTNHAEWPIDPNYTVPDKDACASALIVLQKAGIPQRDAQGKRTPAEQGLINGIQANLTGCPVQ